MQNQMEIESEKGKGSSGIEESEKKRDNNTRMNEWISECKRENQLIRIPRIAAILAKSISLQGILCEKHTFDKPKIFQKPKKKYKCKIEPKNRGGSSKE